MLLVHLRRVSVGARESHRHPLAEPKGLVINSVHLNRRDRKISPVWKLTRD
jgi:hypothetical protein